MQASLDVQVFFLGCGGEAWVKGRTSTTMTTVARRLGPVGGEARADFCELGIATNHHEKLRLDPIRIYGGSITGDNMNM